MHEVLLSGLRELERWGLGLATVLPTDCLGERSPTLEALAGRFPSLILVGSTGGGMWESIDARGFRSRPHPVDEHALAALEALCEGLRPSFEARISWHARCGEAAPVTELGRVAGWAHRSPMGLGIHPVHGLWVAYRGVVLLDRAVPPQTLPGAASPCSTCVDRPCVAACPARAVGGPEGLDLDRCAPLRLAEGSACADRCLARLACPLGRPSRPSLAQIAHHHAASGRFPRSWTATPRGLPEWRSPGDR